MKDERGKPTAIGDVLKAFLREKGLTARVDRARVLIDWAAVVGPQIAAATEPRLVTEDGTLFVGVKTHGWMTELSMLEPSLLAKINALEGRPGIRKIRWELLR